MSGINLVYGENGAGKTNVLEGVYYLQGLNSFRGARRGDLIQHGQSFAILQQSVDTQEGVKSAVIRIDVRGVGALVNSRRPPSYADYRHQFPAIYFSPENYNLVDGSPALRRQYLDTLFSAADPDYAQRLRTYRRILLHRKAAIKRQPSSSALLTAIHHQVALSAERLTNRKMALFSRFKKAFSGQEESPCGLQLKMAFYPKVSYREEMFQRLQKEFTGMAVPIGPHRDELEFTFQGKSARAFASRGQKRLLLFQLKLAELAFLEARTEEEAILVLDDPFSELDERGVSRLKDILRTRQAFLSALTPDALPKSIDVPVATFHISSGVLSSP